MTKILIIDDSIFQRKNIKKILKPEGYKILEASNGTEGLEKIRNDSPDLVLLDILMPQVSGLSVLKKLESEDIEVPVIVITADIQDSTKRECLELGARDVFYKPLPSETQKLRELVRKVLDSEQEET